MKTILKILLLSLVTIAFIKPNNISNNLKTYYFPVTEFKEPQIYKYSDVFNPNSILYWHMKASKDDEKTYLTTTVYDQNFNLIEIFTEELNNSGSEISKYNLFIDSRKIEVELIRNEVFDWNQKIDQKINWSISYSDSGVETIISKTRSFNSETTRIVEGKEYKSIKFRDDFQFKQLNSKNADAYNYFQYSYYSIGIGMTEYIRYFPEGDLVHFKLNTILSKSQWNKLIDKK